ncbi:MAG: hypothetical protein WA139_00620 [Candidatus Aenigmatarchaeota archaeon]
MLHDKNLYGKEVTREEQLKIVYEGPSFEGKIEINDLADELEAIDSLIRTVINELAKRRITAYNSDNIQDIYVSVKKGSFEQYISIIFTNEEFRSYLITFILFFISYFQSKKTEENLIKKIEKQGEIITELVKKLAHRKIKYIHKPLRQEGDIAKFLYDEKELLRISFEDKDKIDKRIQEEEDKIEIEELDQELIGYLSAVNIDTNKFRFHIETINTSAPAILNFSLEDIKELLGKRVKVQAKVYIKLDRIEKIRILSYEEVKKKSLNDYYDKKQ